MTSQAIKYRDRPSGEYKVDDRMQKIARFKEAAENIRSLVADDKMREHPGVNKKLADAVMAISEYALYQGLGKDESGADGYRGPGFARETTRIRTNIEIEGGKHISICTNNFVKKQCKSNVSAVSIIIYEPVIIDNTTRAVLEHAVSIRNPGYGNVADLRPEMALEKLIGVVEQLAKKL
ncbi:hypothetical protein JXA56_02990 [Candidatus Micrarchaeota archaeon]|nr:hypothetical protein [Candidatus Micrarchaeota archaeon]